MISITITEQFDNRIVGQVQKGSIIFYFQINKFSTNWCGIYANMFKIPDNTDYIVYKPDLYGCFKYITENFDQITKKSLLK